MWAVVGTNGYSPGQTHALVPNLGHPVKLRGSIGLSLVTRTWYRVVRGEDDRSLWKVAPIAYSHRLETADEREIVSYHWHPGEESRIVHPHMHLGAGIGADLGMLDKTHIPTGEIRLEDLIRFAIQELGAEPQREEWPQILPE